MLMKFTNVDVLHCLNWSYAYLSTLKKRPFIPVRLIMEGVLVILISFNPFSMPVRCAESEHLELFTDPAFGQQGEGVVGRTDGRKDWRMDGRLEIPPWVLQDIGPLGPLPWKKM